MNVGEKKSWEKPVCVKVRLVPNEAVLWGCKTLDGTSSGPNGDPCFGGTELCYTSTS